jgi:hypothetical protein
VRGVVLPARSGRCLVMQLSAPEPRTFSNYDGRLVML